MKKIYAITAEDLGVQDSIGNISTIGNIFTFSYNLFIYLGWAGVIIGIGFSITSLIFKLMSTPTEEVMEKFRMHIVRALLITLTGIILLSAGFIVSLVAGLLGSSVKLEIPGVFN